MFENAVNGLSPPPVPSIERKARKKKAKVAPPEPPAKVSVKTAVCYVEIFVKGVPETMANNELQTLFNTKALVGRFKSGHCKVLVPESELRRALSQNFVSGHKIRVKPESHDLTIELLLECANAAEVLQLDSSKTVVAVGT